MVFPETSNSDDIPTPRRAQSRMILPELVISSMPSIATKLAMHYLNTGLSMNCTALQLSALRCVLNISVENQTAHECISDG